ncbi:DUF1003 domain-containing protein [Sphaerisporangium fuscum]|uniref:DUF1003 domain-containing protein n=1 Tax=Sphaerisporangium fuscum TaxID=2835868 RepID=UPI001BDC0BA1|nr:DUF1003 domain-containing protein [Sphaerisporangium fuscum]
MVNRLDQPRELRRTIRPHYDPEAFGRLSERIARFLGTARFLVYLTVFITVWVTWNLWVPSKLAFDPYPFIFLTLILSIQASYAAPLILLAQNRQADRDRVQSEQDRLAGERNQAEVEYLTREIAGLRLALGELATRDYIRGELEHLLEEIREPSGEGDVSGRPHADMGEEPHA